MRNLYIGNGQRRKNSSAWKWKLFLFLIMVSTVMGAALMVAGPTMVEKWLNRQGAGEYGFAFSIRDVELSLDKGEVVLNDVKVFNPETTNALLESPKVVLQLKWDDLILSENKKVNVSAEKVDLILSQDFASEVERLQQTDVKDVKDFYLSLVDGKIDQLNLIEKKEELSRTVFALKDVNLKVKDVTLLTITKKTEFTMNSVLTDGGKFSLTAKLGEEKAHRTPWVIKGNLKQVPASIFNKIAGDKLPFSFIESHLNADITAYSEQGQVSGEIVPDIRKLNLIDERPGVPTQIIARLLTEDLTFTLPFTLKESVNVEYQETYRRLKSYRKYPVTTARTESATSSTEKKSESFWPF